MIARAKNPQNEFLNQPDLSLIIRVLLFEVGDEVGASAGSHGAKTQVTTNFVWWYCYYFIRFIKDQ